MTTLKLFVAAAAMLFVGTGAAMAQDNVFESFSFQKMASVADNPWTENQELDGVSIYRKKSDLTCAFAKGDGESAPQYTKYTNSKGNESTDCAARLFVGNTMTLSSTKNTITKVVFTFTSKSHGAIDVTNKNTNETKPNYESTPAGSYTGDRPYTWTGSTQTLTLKNLTNKGCIELLKVDVYYTTSTGITRVETIVPAKKQGIYTLAGQRVSQGNVEKGKVYIINGKKILK